MRTCVPYRFVMYTNNFILISTCCYSFSIYIFSVDKKKLLRDAVSLAILMHCTFALARVWVNETTIESVPVCVLCSLLLFQFTCLSIIIMVEFGFISNQSYVYGVWCVQCTHALTPQCASNFDCYCSFCTIFSCEFSSCHLEQVSCSRFYARKHSSSVPFT